MSFEIFALNITGIVTDSEGAPVPYVTVILEETGFIGYTEQDGSFLIPELPPSEYSLIIESDLYLGRGFFFTLEKNRDFHIQLKSAVFDVEIGFSAKYSF